MTTTNLLSQREAAARLGLSPRTLERNRATGDGPAFIKLGARVLYRPEDLATWITSRIRTSTSDTGARQ
jgi:predicted DNA-binding transcriptional regulator AlpA